MQLKSREEKESFACNHDSSHKNSDFCHSPQSGHQTKLQNVISRLRITVLRARGAVGMEHHQLLFWATRVFSSLSPLPHCWKNEDFFVTLSTADTTTLYELVFKAMVSFFLASPCLSRIIIVWTKVWDSHSCFPNCRQKIALHDLVILFYFCANRSPKPLAVSQWGTKHQGKIQSHVF